MKTGRYTAVATQPEFGLNKILISMLPLLLTPAAVVADDSALLTCRRIEQPTQRLACYDALASQTTSPGAPVKAEERFGLAPRPAAEEGQAMESHIPGRFDGWGPKTRIRLANGQLWEVSDGSSGAYQLVDPKVRIRRGAFGSFFLEIEHQNRSPKVRRVE